MEHFPLIGDFSTRLEFNDAIHKSVLSKGIQSPRAKGIICVIQQNPPLSSVFAYGRKNLFDGMFRDKVPFSTIR